MMSYVPEETTVMLNASAAATAWLNAFLATGQDDERPLLYRSICVEFFPQGVQFIACDGTMLFRAFVPVTQTDEEWPADDVAPDRSVVVLDGSYFALGFIRTLLTVAKAMEYAELSLTIELAPEQDGEAPLGSAFSSEVLTLRALGQQLHCRLYEDAYVNWRDMSFGIGSSERVDGMKLSPRMFAAVGRLKSIEAVECTFTGDEKHIVVTGDRSFRGILMPMRRKEKEKEKEKPAPESDDDAQTDALDGSTTVSMNGGPQYPNTKAGMRAAVEGAFREEARSGRDRAAGKDE